MKGSSLVVNTAVPLRYWSGAVAISRLTNTPDAHVTVWVCQNDAMLVEARDGGDCGPLVASAEVPVDRWTGEAS